MGLCMHTYMHVGFWFMTVRIPFSFYLGSSEFLLCIAFLLMDGRMDGWIVST